MHRIATAMLIVGAVLALNAGMLRDVFARETASPVALPRTEITLPIVARSDKVLSLLLILESLRQSQLGLDGQKV